MAVSQTPYTLTHPTHQWRFFRQWPWQQTQPPVLSRPALSPPKSRPSCGCFHHGPMEFVQTWTWHTPKLTVYVALEGNIWGFIKLVKFWDNQIFIPKGFWHVVTNVHNACAEYHHVSWLCGRVWKSAARNQPGTRTRSQSRAETY